MGHRAEVLNKAAIVIVADLPDNLKDSIQKEGYVCDADLAELEIMKSKREGQLAKIEETRDNASQMTARGLMTEKAFLHLKDELDNKEDGIRLELEKIQNTLDKSTTRADLEKLEAVAFEAFKKITDIVKLYGAMIKRRPDKAEKREEIYNIILTDQSAGGKARRLQIREVLSKLLEPKQSSLVATRDKQRPLRLFSCTSVFKYLLSSLVTNG